MNFEPCHNAKYGCDNYLIAETSQDEGLCAQCRAQWEADAKEYAAQYAREKGRGWESKAEYMEDAGKPFRCEYCGNPIQAESGECKMCQEYGEPCQNCRQRGQMKGGDTSDCRSVDCMGSKCDAAMAYFDDRD